MFSFPHTKLRHAGACLCRDKAASADEARAQKALRSRSLTTSNQYRFLSHYFYITSVFVCILLPFSSRTKGRMHAAKIKRADYNLKPNQFREIKGSVICLDIYFVLQGLHLKWWSQNSNNSIPLKCSAWLFFLPIGTRMSGKRYLKLDTTEQLSQSSLLHEVLSTVT